MWINRACEIKSGPVDIWQPGVAPQGARSRVAEQQIKRNCEICKFTLYFSRSVQVGLNSCCLCLRIVHTLLSYLLCWCLHGEGPFTRAVFYTLFRVTEMSSVNNTESTFLREHRVGLTLKSISDGCQVSNITGMENFENKKRKKTVYVIPKLETLRVGGECLVKPTTATRRQGPLKSP